MKRRVVRFGKTRSFERQNKLTKTLGANRVNRVEQLQLILQLKVPNWEVFCHDFGVGGGGGGVALLSPVDSGIGQELLLEQAKQVFIFFYLKTINCFYSFNFHLMGLVIRVQALGCGLGIR